MHHKGFFLFNGKKALVYHGLERKPIFLHHRQLLANISFETVKMYLFR